MVNISFKDDEAILKFPKQLVNSSYVQEFFDRLRIETIVAKSELSEKQAWELSEEIKLEWWKKNKDKFLKRIN